MNETIIAGIVGLVSSVVSSLLTWILAKRKYNAEVDNNLIANMQQALDFYKQLCDDNKERLKEQNKRLEQIEQENIELRKQMFNLMNQVCVDLTCKLRQTTLKIQSQES